MTSERDGSTIRGRAAESGFSTLDLLIVAACIGLATGFTEAALLGVAKFQLGRILRVNPQAAWLAPVAYVLLFTVVTMIVVLVRRGRPSLRAVIFLCAWLGGTGVLFTHQPLHQGAAILLAAGVATQAASLGGRFAHALRQLSRRLVLPAAALVPVLFLAVNVPAWQSAKQAEGSRTPATAGAPNVLLIIWDTVRAASLSAYGYARPTTPTLARLAAGGALFESAFSTAPWTTPAHASLFTGLYPAQTSVGWVAPLDDSPRTLAEVLSAAGYRTAGITANTFATSRESGLDRGFAHYDDFNVFSPGDLLLSMSLVRSVLTRHEAWRHNLGIGAMPGHKPAIQVEREFLDWMDRAPERPFFAFLNYFDAHVPYLPPAPFDTMFGPWLPGRNPHMFTGRQYTPRELQAEIDAYDGAIRFLDERLDSLLVTLDRRGVLQNTIVVVTADHGEEFGEHGVYTHGHSLYDAVLRVPLVIHYPARVPATTRVSSFTTIRDVPSTILELAGLRDELPGQSLSRHWDSAGQAGADTVLAAVDQVSGNPPHYPVSKGDLTAVFADPLKLIRSTADPVELYDLRRDPGERVNLANDPQWRAARDSLLGILDRQRTRSP
jgi:arylsulfatase A-like enzyme